MAKATRNAWVRRMAEKRITVIGGGAAGFFAAIAAAETAPGARVELWEASPRVLAKVRISGGGRCNVTHACFEPRELVKRYPRGARELLGPLHRWGPRDTIAWFAERGVELKTEADGRMFPITDDSATIVDCLERAAAAAGVRLRLRQGARGLVAPGGERSHFLVTPGEGAPEPADRVIIATGGPRGAGGAEWAAALGHAVEPPVPSLFTFNIADPRLAGLEGLSVPDAETSVPGTKLRERGPLLITHWGLSGPAVLKLSAWGARELAERDYRFELRVNWAGGLSREALQAAMAENRTGAPRRQISSVAPAGLPGRLWERLVVAAGVPGDQTWAGVSKERLQALAGQVAQGSFAVAGKSTNKEEFVTCGGVRLREVDFKRMESRLVPGLFFAGEVLDIDGVTGGFNFQAAWTTGRIAGESAAAADSPE